MNKGEIVVAVNAYKAGYEQACEDFGKALIQSHKKVFEAELEEVAKKLDELMKQSSDKYFDSLTKKK